MTRVRPRPVLDGLVDEIERWPLTTVVAPAGSGKSTLLTAWWDGLAGRFHRAWLDLDPLHTDPASFASDLLRAIHVTIPGFGVTTRRTLENTPNLDSVWQPLVRSLRNDLYEAGQPLFCFFDNYHHLAGSASDGLLSELLRSAPSGLRLIVSSRGFVPAVTARLRAADQVRELTSADLNLSAEEIAAILADRRVDPDPTLVSALHSQTDGWTTGVLLAARALSRLDPSDRLGFARSITQHPDLFEFLAAELLAGEPAELVGLLELAAVLRRADAALFEAAGYSAEWSGQDVARVIERGLGRGLLQTDGREVWLHQLWQSLLLGRLRLRLDGAAWHSVHQRSAQALTQRGRIDEALAAYRDAGDTANIARLLTEHGFDLIGRGRHSSVLAWLTHLPKSLQDSDPGLIRLHALCLSLGQPEQAITLMATAVERFAAAGQREEEFWAAGDLLYLGYTQNRTEHFRAAIKRMLTLRRFLASPSTSVSTLITILALQAFISHRFRRSLRLTRLAMRFPLSTIEFWSNSLIRVALLVLRGDWVEAQQVIDQALADRRIRDHGPSYFSLLGNRALISALEGNADAVVSDAEAAYSAFSEFRLMRFQVLVGNMYGRILTCQGNRTEAGKVYERCYELQVAANDQAGAGFSAALRAFQAFVGSDNETANRWAVRAVEHFERKQANEYNVWYWAMLGTIWVIHRTGEPERARALLATHRSLFQAPDLPYMHHLMLITLADLDRGFGDEVTAGRLAIEGWRLAAQHRLTGRFFEFQPGVSAWTGQEAIRHGVAVDYVFARLQELCSDLVPDLLAGLLADSSAPVRLRAVDLIQRTGSARAYAALRTAARDPDRTVREAVARALTNYQPVAPYRISVTTLGEFQLNRGDQAVPDTEWRGIVAKRLFWRLLAARGRPITRSQLYDQLWPDADEAAGQHNLRAALNRLNEILEPDRASGAQPSFTVPTNDTIALRFDLFDWDVDVFSRQARRALDADHRSNQSRLELERAAELFTGVYLPNEADSWHEPIRRQLGELFEAIVSRLGENYLTSGDTDGAITLARRRLADEPAAERAWALVIRAFLARGDRTSAIRTFQQAVETLRRELDAAPGDELLSLAERSRG